MASGDTVYSNSRQKLVLLADAAGGTTNGVWIECGDYLGGLVSLSLGGSTVEVDGSNASTMPAAATHGFPLATAGAVDGLLSIPVLSRFIKARVTAFVGAANVAIMLRTAR